MDLCVLGEYLIDFVPVGKNKDGLPVYTQNPGGAPTNVACAAAKLGVSSGVITKISNDSFGNFLYDYITDLDVVDTRGVTRGSEPTGLAFVTLGENGERDFVFFRDNCADSSLRISDVDISLIEECSVFHFSSVSLVADPARSTTLYVAKKAKELGKTVSFDINYRSFLWKDENEAKRLVYEAMQYCDIIKASEEEAVIFGGSIGKSAVNFRKAGPSIVIITLGEAGAVFSTPLSDVKVPSYKVDAVDTTGAGDNFMGAFLSRIIKCGKNIKNINADELLEMIRFSNAAGALCASRYGAIAGQPSEKEILELINGQTDS